MPFHAEDFLRNTGKTNYFYPLVMDFIYYILATPLDIDSWVILKEKLNNFIHSYEDDDEALAAFGIRDKKFFLTQLNTPQRFTDYIHRLSPQKKIKLFSHFLARTFADALNTTKSLGSKQKPHTEHIVQSLSNFYPYAHRVLHKEFKGLPHILRKDNYDPDQTDAHRHLFFGTFPENICRALDRLNAHAAGSTLSQAYQSAKRHAVLIHNKTLELAFNQLLDEALIITARNTSTRNSLRVTRACDMIYLINCCIDRAIRNNKLSLNFINLIYHKAQGFAGQQGIGHFLKFNAPEKPITMAGVLLHTLARTADFKIMQQTILAPDIDRVAPKGDGKKPGYTFKMQLPSSAHSGLDFKHKLPPKSARPIKNCHNVTFTVKQGDGFQDTVSELFTGIFFQVLAQQIAQKTTPSSPPIQTTALTHAILFPSTHQSGRYSTLGEFAKNFYVASDHGSHYQDVLPDDDNTHSVAITMHALAGHKERPLFAGTRQRVQTDFHLFDTILAIDEACDLRYADSFWAAVDSCDIDFNPGNTLLKFNLNNIQNEQQRIAAISEIDTLNQIINTAQPHRDQGQEAEYRNILIKQITCIKALDVGVSFQKIDHSYGFSEHDQRTLNMFSSWGFHLSNIPLRLPFNRENGAPVVASDHISEAAGPDFDSLVLSDRSCDILMSRTMADFATSMRHAIELFHQTIRVHAAQYPSPLEAELFMLQALYGHIHGKDAVSQLKSLKPGELSNRLVHRVNPITQQQLLSQKIAALKHEICTTLIVNRKRLLIAEYETISRRLLTKLNMNQKQAALFGFIYDQLRQLKPQPTWWDRFCSVFSRSPTPRIASIQKPPVKKPAHTHSPRLYQPAKPVQTPASAHNLRCAPLDGDKSVPVTFTTAF